MSAEMSAASVTYAQWLDDSTQVSAKDLVNQLCLSHVFTIFMICTLRQFIQQLLAFSTTAALGVESLMITC